MFYQSDIFKEKPTEGFEYFFMFKIDFESQ